eukprot:CAMPEP_0184725516 /NCGR_PEP_ID=MMETSP0314-20130426/31154_1 /TAXON_ID=38298 /ORGANISM="Rhodella maculata, Strain CCMP 736" /LENGTH=169 /DNA_ID=CAMNT_0027190765 /DNA_START=1 /DNA_END=506 /DNA_ORIENTATION=+
MVLSPPFLKIHASPNPGLSVECKLSTFSNLNFVTSLESNFNNTSRIAYSLEPFNFPFTRLQISPTPAFTIQIPFLRLSDHNRLFCGLTLAPNPAKAPETSSGAPTPSPGAFAFAGNKLSARIVFGVEHAETAMSTLLNEQQKAFLRERVEEHRQKSAEGAKQVGRRVLA